MARHIRNFTLFLLSIAFAFALYSGGFFNANALEKKSESAVSAGKTAQAKEKIWSIPMNEKVRKSDQEWKEILTPEEYEVTRKKGTERAFTGKYNDHHEHGIYRCTSCGAPLFHSDHKFDSGSGWPSYYEPLCKDKVELKMDNTLGMSRVEVICARCEAHLGHVFDDGPPPTGQRYCINSVALAFEKTDKDGRIKGQRVTSRADAAAICSEDVELR